MFIRAKVIRHRPVVAVVAVLLAFGLAGCATSSKFQGRSAADLYALGQQEFEAREYDEAIETLDRLLLAFPGFEQAADARFLLARAYFEDEQYLLAADEYMRFLERHGGNPRAPEAALGVCRSHASLSPITPRDQTYTRQAASVCRNVVSDYAGHEVAQEAQRIANDMRGKLAKKEYENGDFYFRRGGMDSAIVVWELVVEEYADTDWAPLALLGIIKAYEEIGYEDLVEEYRQQLLNSYPDSDAAREIRGGSPTG